MKKTLFKYYLSIFALMLIKLMIFYVTIIISNSKILGMIMLVAACIADKYVIDYFQLKTIFKLIYRDFNLREYEKIILGRHLYVGSFLEIGNLHLYNCEFQKALDMSAWCERTSKRVENKLYALSLAACIYFYLNDFDALKAACQRYDEYISKCPKKAELFKEFENYKLYLDNRSEELIDIYQKQLASLERKSLFYNLPCLTTAYRLGVLYYKNGDFDNARTIFEKTVADAPEFVYAKLAQKYLDQMDSGAFGTVEFEKFIPNENYIYKRVKTRRLFILIYCVTFVIMTVFGSYLTFKIEQSIQRSDLYKEIGVAIDVEYDDFKMLGYYYIYSEEDEHISSVALVSYDGKIDMVSVWVDKDGNTGITTEYRDILIGYQFGIVNLKKDHAIYFKLTDNKDSLNSPKKVYKLEIDGEDMYLAVVRINKLQ